MAREVIGPSPYFRTRKAVFSKITDFVFAIWEAAYENVLRDSHKRLSHIKTLNQSTKIRLNSLSIQIKKKGGDFLSITH